MQNLAMDFFLRQQVRPQQVDACAQSRADVGLQMDTAGWIDIAMIASFNRIKSLTPEVPLVKEMMEVSSLLEVQGDVVRLKGDLQKWILPTAKTSTIPYSEPLPLPGPATTGATSNAGGAAGTGEQTGADSTASPSATTLTGLSAASDAGEVNGVDHASADTSLPDELDVSRDFGGAGYGGVGLGLAGAYTPGGVEHALMKNIKKDTTPTPTASSIGDSTKPEDGDGDGDVVQSTSTPGTSIAEGEADDKAER